jgi:ankyrin repeat protein
MLAAANGNNKISARLIQSRSELDHKNNTGDTALLIAIRAKQRDVIKQLLDAGADTAPRNNRREYARGLAESMGNSEVVKMIDEQSGGKKHLFGLF